MRTVIVVFMLMAAGVANAGKPSLSGEDGACQRQGNLLTCTIRAQAQNLQEFPQGGGMMAVVPHAMGCASMDMIASEAPFGIVVQEMPEQCGYAVFGVYRVRPGEALDGDITVRYKRARR